jgi:hypothetical protein
MYFFENFLGGGAEKKGCGKGISYLDTVFSWGGNTTDSTNCSHRVSSESSLPDKTHKVGRRPAFVGLRNKCTS